MAVNLRNISQREKRWSMNSQRLEKILAELMKPISDVRRSFDTDLSALLEEYLTEAGLHALDAEEGGISCAVPNFAELALLLQQSASIYSRKVDFLYQHVLNVSDSLHQSTQEARADGAVEPQTVGARRKRRASAPQDFTPLSLEASVVRREAPLRPPPTLPRLYAELAPRVPGPQDVPLRDYAGEPVGLLPDFHVFWRLQEGYLVEEVGSTPASVRIAPPAPAPDPPPSCPRCPSPAPGTPSCDRSPSPLPGPPYCARSPSPADCGPPPAASTPLPPDKRERKRRSDIRTEELLDWPVALKVGKEVRACVREFSLPRAWLRRVVRGRCERVLAARRLLPDSDPTEPAKDFEFPHEGGAGFPGWSGAEATRGRRAEDSDDDGFFEQSSLASSDGSRGDDCSPADGGAWREAVVARAMEGEARGRDVRRAARTVLEDARRPPSPRPFRDLLARTARHPAQVSELFLATLFLANAGNVEIIQGAPLTVDSFAVRFVSDDRRLYGAALDEPPAQPQTQTQLQR